MLNEPFNALEVSNLSYRYGDREALKAVNFTVSEGEIFGLLGPNGGGKTTLFKIVSTLIAPLNGTVSVFGHNIMSESKQVRREIGVLFQAPALDIRLTVEENLRCHGRLYGLRGHHLADRIRYALSLVKLEDRGMDLVGALSGGLQRRAELAKALLPSPKLLILDEPSTGLDPVARRDIWENLEQLSQQKNTTIIVTTHLMDEAAQCKRVGILHNGNLVAIGSPESLTSSIEGDVIMITTPNLNDLAKKIREQFGERVKILPNHIRINRKRAHELVAKLVESFPEEIDTITFGKPTLDDVFMYHTGRLLD